MHIITVVKIIFILKKGGHVIVISYDKGNKLKKVLQEEILSGVSSNIKEVISSIPEHYINELEEIRIRLNKPLMIQTNKTDYMITSRGTITKNPKEAYEVSKEDCEKTVQLLSNYSIYAIEEELKSGYITLKGGHRVGIVGRGIIENGRIKALKNISGFNIRIARQVIGAADKLIKYIVKDYNDIYNTLVISPPQCGKTTLLRDIIRQLSNGVELYNITGLKIGLVDERSEIAGSYHGIPQNDLGLRTDVLDACPKSQGLLMLIRSMSPNVVATDEIGSKHDTEALYEALNAGIRVITTVHGNGLEDILNRPFVNELVKNQFFGRLVVLSSKLGPGTVEEIIDGKSLKTIVKGPFR